MNTHTTLRPLAFGLYWWSSGPSLVDCAIQSDGKVIVKVVWKLWRYSHSIFLR